MLKRQILLSNAALAGLTDEQITIIEKLSENDENAVIADKVRDIHTRYDETIFKATGVKREGDEKSYKYLERAALEIKSKADSANELTAQIETLSKEKSKLEKQLKEAGADTELQAKYDALVSELADTKQAFNDATKSIADVRKEYDGKILNMQLDSHINEALKNVKLRADLPESVTKLVLNNVVKDIKSLNPAIEQDGESTRLVFRKPDGGILTNQENQLNPFSALELITSKLKEAEVLADPKPIAGTGTLPKPKPTQPGGVDISGARTQVEAHSIIANHLAAQGLAKGSTEYAAKEAELFRESGVSELPISL